MPLDLEHRPTTVSLRPLTSYDVGLVAGLVDTGPPGGAWSNDHDALGSLLGLCVEGRALAVVGCVGTPREPVGAVLLLDAHTGRSPGCDAPDDALEISYWTRPQFRGRRLTTRLVTGALALAGRHHALGGRPVIGHTTPDNAASYAVLARLGRSVGEHTGLTCVELVGEPR